MKRLILSVVLSALTFSALGADKAFCPQTWNKINVDGDSTMFVWGVPGLNGKALVANPDYGWPTEASVFTWRQTLLNARTVGGCVTIYYDSTMNEQGGYDLWSITE